MENKGPRTGLACEACRAHSICQGCIKPVAHPPRLTALATALGCSLQPFRPLSEEDTFGAALQQVTQEVRRVPVVSADGQHITNVLSQSALLQAILEMDLPEVRSLARGERR